MQESTTVQVGDIQLTIHNGAVYLTLPKDYVFDHQAGNYQSPIRQYVFLPQQPALLESD